jgi:hypothetical protein
MSLRDHMVCREALSARHTGFCAGALRYVAAVKALSVPADCT